ncbi:MAG: HypC/HybG/HupF family hydrogenase formation chaperone [Candidatus Woesearchaeota archaeon]
MKPEVFFLKYSFPCALICQQMGEIDEAEVKELEDAATTSVPLPREKLERIFFRAFKRIDSIAEELGRDRWDLDVLEEFFLKRHNEIVEKGFEISGKVPRTLKELCKVHVAEIVEKKGDVLIVKFGNKTRPVHNKLVPEAKVGDLVTIHYGYAVEIVS